MSSSSEIKTRLAERSWQVRVELPLLVLVAGLCIYLSLFLMALSTTPMFVISFGVLGLIRALALGMLAVLGMISAGRAVVLRCSLLVIDERMITEDDSSSMGDDRTFSSNLCCFISCILMPAIGIMLYFVGASFLSVYPQMAIGLYHLIGLVILSLGVAPLFFASVNTRFGLPRHQSGHDHSAAVQAPYVHASELLEFDIAQESDLESDLVLSQCKSDYEVWCSFNARELPQVYGKYNFEHYPSL